MPLLRNLRRRLPFVVAALATLAVSLGASTAVFTLVNSFLLSSLPYADAERLVVLWRSHAAPSGEEIEDQLPLAPGEYSDLTGDLRAFEQVTGLISEMVTVTAAGEPARLHLMLEMGDVFSLLGLRAARGRLLGPDDELPDAPPVAVISHDHWQRQLGGASDVVGRTLEIGGRGYEIVGVLPADFRLIEGLDAANPRLSQPVDVWVPFSLGDGAHQRGYRFVYALARLRPGVAPAVAQEEATAYATEAARRHPDTDQGYGLRVVPLHEQVFGPLRPALLALWAATGFVLLIACANLATLLLARGQGRQRDFAVRLALGASRRRILGESLLESTALAVFGGALALLLAAAATRLLSSAAPVRAFHVFPPELDLRVIMFTLAAALAAGVLFGLGPAYRASRARLTGDLGERGGQLDRRSRLTFSILVVAQIALTTTLLVGVGLAASSYLRLLNADLGVDTEGVATFDLSLPLSKYRESPRKVDLLRRLLDGVAALPGVESVGMNYALPFSGVDPSNGFTIEGRSPDPEESWSANLGLVNADYFETLGIPLLRGRLFRESDHAQAPEVAIVDQRMVERYFRGADPIGRRLAIASDRMATIVGVVGSIRHDVFEEQARPYVYLPYQQRAYMFTSLAVATGRDDPLSIVPEVRRLVRELDPEVPISNVGTLEGSYGRLIAPQRFSLSLIGGITAIALFLSLIGTYGVMSLLARYRVREVGIRMALGAAPRDVCWLLVRHGLLLSAVGAAVGLAAAAGLRTLMEGLVYGIGTLDAVVYGLVAAATLLAAFLAYYPPARWLGSVDPIGVIRSF